MTRDARRARGAVRGRDAGRAPDARPSSTHLCFGANEHGDADEVFGDERGAAVMQTPTVRRARRGVAGARRRCIPTTSRAGSARSSSARSIERAAQLGAHDVLLAERDPPLPLARRRHREHARRDAARDARLRARVGRHQHGDRHVVPAAAARRRHRRARDRAPARTTSRRPRIPHWVPELDRAVELGTAFAARDADGRDDRLRVPLGEPRRAGSARWRPTRRSSTAASARPCSAALCADLEARGIATGEISWVSNLRFYGKCGARVSRRLPRRPARAEEL